MAAAERAVWACQGVAPLVGGAEVLAATVAATEKTVESKAVWQAVGAAAAAKAGGGRNHN